jgi:nicotinate-nucleotide pyrophosphorylase (carboxylating)
LNQLLFNQLLSQEIQQMCSIALQEDLAGNENTDVTAELIAQDKSARARLITREQGIFCGKKWVNTIFELLSIDSSGQPVTAKWQVEDGDNITPGQTLCEFEGNARQLLTGERSAMNFLQTLSATATLTKQYIEIMDNTNCKLLDTRKTIPGMRFGQKYAVKCGGGSNHRIGLSDAYLIKENHIMACGGIEKALSRAISAHPDRLLEIEVENLSELTEALEGKAQVIMLDNFDINALLESVKLRDSLGSPAKLEASGNVNLDTIKPIAETGVDYISVGALTKDVKAIDLSLRIEIN